jgi:hypothetical protein
MLARHLSSMPTQDVIDVQAGPCPAWHQRINLPHCGTLAIGTLLLLDSCAE